MNKKEKTRIQVEEVEKDLMFGLAFDWRKCEEEGIYLMVFDGEEKLSTNFFVSHEAFWSVVHAWISRLPASQFRIKYTLIQAIKESDHPIDEPVERSNG